MVEPFDGMGVLARPELGTTKRGHQLGLDCPGPDATDRKADRARFDVFADKGRCERFQMLELGYFYFDRRFQLLSKARLKLMNFPVFPLFKKQWVEREIERLYSQSVSVPKAELERLRGNGRRESWSQSLQSSA